MAKKKQIELTIEEKLQNALVPKEEQPYKIPNNWCWTYVSNVMNIVMGQSPKGVDTTQNVSDIPLIGGASDMGDLYPRVNKYTKKATKLSKEDDVILSIRATLGRPIFSDGVYCLGRGVAGISSNYLSKEFIRYYYICFESGLYSNATGTTFLQVTGSVLNKMLIPLPPIKEQQRIVNIIESLFAKLDKAKELIENTLAQFEQNKMAILHKAFTGELTAKWRKENNINNIKDVSYIEKLPYIVPNGWYWDKLENITIRIVDGDHNPPAKEKEKTSYIMLSAQNIGYSSFINMDKVRYLSKDNFDKCHKRTCLEDGDILFSSVGSIGNAMVYREKENDKITFQRSVTIIKTKINPYYLRYVLLSPYCQQIFKTESIGTAQKGFYIKQMKSLIVPVPTIEEQQEIVNILDNLLAKYNKIKNLEQQLEKIELLKKAILAKAFRGELGTNNPDEESAENLLKEILVEK